MQYLPSSLCHYKIYKNVKLRKVNINISVFKTREHLKNSSKFIVCKIFSITQLIYDSLNSSGILNTDRFIKMHGLQFNGWLVGTIPSPPLLNFKNMF